MSEQVIEQPKKIHPFSKEAKEARAKEAKQEQDQEAEKEPTFEELYNLPVVDPDKHYQFEFLDVRQNANQGVVNHCEIFDPVQKRIRVIRYSPHEESIFQDEQKELPKGGYYEDFVQFPYSLCQVDGRKKNLVHYLCMHNSNVENKNPLPSRQPKFKVVDKEADARKALEVNAVRQKATQMASECDDSEMIPYAKVLGINIDRSPAEIRREFVVKASVNPIEFIRGLSDPKNKRLYVVLKAFEQGQIEDSYIKNQINWRGSKVKICDVPAGAISSDYLVDFSFNSKDGEESYKQLLKSVVI